MIRRFVITLAAATLATATSYGQGTRAPLPTPADAVGPGFDQTQLLGGPSFGTTGHAPGPIDDHEGVRVDLDRSGSPLRVSVDQILDLRGTGDYSLSIQGPALAVEAPADQVVQPGLRRGRIVWQGFVNQTQTLRSTITLDPTFELSRLPLAVKVRVTDPSGHVLDPPYSGPVDVEVSLTNQTARPVTVHRGSPARGDLAKLLDALARTIRSGKRPIAGVAGIPKDLPGNGPVTTVSQSIAVPLRVVGRVGVEPIDATLLSDAPKRFSFKAQGDDLAVEFHVDAALPPVEDLGAVGVADAYGIAQRVMWQALRGGELDAHLGNPGRGKSSTSFLYRTISASSPPRAVPEKIKPMGLALAIVALLAASANAVVLWRTS